MASKYQVNFIGDCYSKNEFEYRMEQYKASVKKGSASVKKGLGCGVSFFAFCSDGRYLLLENMYRKRLSFNAIYNRCCFFLRESLLNDSNDYCVMYVDVVFDSYNRVTANEIKNNIVPVEFYVSLAKKNKIKKNNFLERTTK